MLQGIKDNPSTDKHKEAKSILQGLGEIRAKEEPDFIKTREEYMSFLQDPSKKLKKNANKLGAEFVKVSQPTMDKFEDLCKFIKTSERQHDGNEPVEMRKGAKSGQDRNIPSGMSFLESDRSSAMDKKENKVYIPAAFQKSRKQKIEEQNEMLNRMQALMNDAKVQTEKD